MWLTKSLQNDGAGGERFGKAWLQGKRAIEPCEGMAQIAGIEIDQAEDMHCSARQDPHIA